jgi:hypothetical protein
VAGWVKVLDQEALVERPAIPIMVVIMAAVVGRVLEAVAAVADYAIKTTKL